MQTSRWQLFQIIKLFICLNCATRDKLNKMWKHMEEVALVTQCVKDWAKKQRAPSSRSSLDKNSGGGRSQSTTKLCQGTNSTTPAAKQMG